MSDYVDKGLKRVGITISKPVLAMVCIVFGVMVVLFPNLLVWIVGLFLVIQGALLLADYFEQESRITKMSQSRMVYCYSCGVRNTEEAVYCKQCGKKLEQTEQVVTAPAKEVVQWIQNWSQLSESKVNKKEKPVELEGYWGNWRAYRKECKDGLLFQFLWLWKKLQSKLSSSRISHNTQRQVHFLFHNNDRRTYLSSL